MVLIVFGECVGRGDGVDSVWYVCVQFVVVVVVVFVVVAIAVGEITHRPGSPLPNPVLMLSLPYDLVVVVVAAADAAAVVVAVLDIQ